MILTKLSSHFETQDLSSLWVKSLPCQSVHERILLAVVDVSEMLQGRLTNVVDDLTGLNQWHCWWRSGYLLPWHGPPIGLRLFMGWKTVQEAANSNGSAVGNADAQERPEREGNVWISHGTILDKFAVEPEIRLRRRPFRLHKSLNYCI